MSETLEQVEKTSQTPVAKKRKKEGSETKPKPSLPSRFTRSQIVPDWNVEEMLVLVNEVAAVNEDCLKTLSSYQRWKMISDNCMTLAVVRSSNQCKRKWESMLAEYKMIKDWESRSGAGSFWCLESQKKKEYGLPAFFDRELFGAISDFLKDQEARPDSDMDSESEGLIRKIKTAMHDVVVVNDLGTNSSTRSKTFKSKTNQAQEISRKLHESTRQIQAILRGELSETAGGTWSSMDLTKLDHETEFARRQGDELIKVFGTLVGNLNQFVEILKESG